MKKTALITGASSGIGKELATIFAREGYDLVLVARSEDKLNEVKTDLETTHTCTVHVFIQDLSKPDAAHNVYSYTTEKQLTIDVLVNNAGFGDYASFVDMDQDKMRSMIAVNMTAVTELSHLFLPAMKQRGSGRVLNVASSAAFQPGPYMAVYFATKAYVLHLSEAINQELKGSGVNVTALCPGPTKTGFESQASKQGLSFFKGGVMSASVVAQAGFDALMQNKPVIIPGIKNKFLTFLNRITPRSLVTTIMQQMLGK